MPEIDEQMQTRIRTHAATQGYKAANLRELQELSTNSKFKDLRVQIPEFYSLSHRTIEAHLDKYAEYWRAHYEEFQRVQGTEKGELKSEAMKILAELRTLIQKTMAVHPLTDKELQSFLASLTIDEPLSIIVRSTGEEDKFNMTNPGGNETVSAVQPTISALSKACGIVVSSYFSEKSLKQRLLSPEKDITKKSFMPVLIQRMIGEPVNGTDKPDDIVRSGVMFTTETAIKIQITPGHGEAVVDSIVPVDTCLITRKSVIYWETNLKINRLIPTEIEDKEYRKLSIIRNPKKIQQESSIPSAVAIRLASAGRAIHDHYGMPMDIEFVYAPKKDIIYLVQARPLNKHKSQNIIPSSVPPNKLRMIAKNVIKMPTIAAAGNAARVITNKEAVLTCITLEEGLRKFLQQKSSSVKTIIVHEQAASNSHAAQVFNQLAIPVMQLEEHKQIDLLLQTLKPVLIIDPQRGQLINWTDKIKNHSDAENELYQDGILEQGLFSLPVTALQLTPLHYLSESKAKESSAAFFRLQEKATPQPTYQSLLTSIQTLEAAEPSSANPETHKALATIATTFKKLGLSTQSKEKINPHRQLMLYAVMLVWEIENCLQHYNEVKEVAESHLVREELLTLIAKLKSIVIYPGNLTTFSDSILQIAQENKAIKIASLPGIVKLDANQFSYFVQFIKLQKNIWNSEDLQKWQQFALQCAQSGSKTQQLSHLIKYSLHYGIESDLLNLCFLRHYDEQAEKKEILFTQTILTAMKDELKQTAVELELINLEKAWEIIRRWESYIHEWSDPNKFEALFSDFQKEIEPLFLQLKITEEMTLLAKNAVIKAVQELIEIIDKSIKTQKGSYHYLPEQIILQVTHFGKLLIPYHKLMEIWLRKIPEYEYCKWQPFGHSDFHRNSVKERILYTIKSTLDNNIQYVNKIQLYPSRSFSVAATRIGSTASFQREFMDKSGRFTSEDLFSLIHQNLVFATGYFHTKIREKKLPLELQPLLRNIRNISVQSNKVQLIQIKQQHPWIKLEYNMPLENHAAQFFIEYNTITKKFIFHGKFFGHDNNERMTKLAKNAGLESILLNKIPAKPAYYDEYRRELQFTFEHIAQDFLLFSEIIPKVISAYAHATFISMQGRVEAITEDSIFFRHRYSPYICDAKQSLIDPKIPSPLFESKHGAALKALFEINSCNEEKLPLTVQQANEFFTADFFWHHGDLMNASLVNKLIAKLNIPESIISFSYVFVNSNSEELADLIKKYKINEYSIQRGLKSALIKGNFEIAQLCIQNGASINEVEMESIASACNIPKLKPLAVKILTAMPLEKIRSFLNRICEESFLYSNEEPPFTDEFLAICLDIDKKFTPSKLSGLAIFANYSQTIKKIIQNFKDEITTENRQNLFNEAIRMADVKTIPIFLEIGFQFPSEKFDEYALIKLCQNESLKKLIVKILQDNSLAQKVPSVESIMKTCLFYSSSSGSSLFLTLAALEKSSEFTINNLYAERNLCELVRYAGSMPMKNEALIKYLQMSFNLYSEKIKRRIFLLAMDKNIELCLFLLKNLKSIDPIVTFALSDVGINEEILSTIKEIIHESYDLELIKTIAPQLTQLHPKDECLILKTAQKAPMKEIQSKTNSLHQNTLFYETKEMQIPSDAANLSVRSLAPH